MKILVASINFAPDHSGIGVYSTDFPVYLAEFGHEVTMVSGFSYYPRWKKLPGDRGRLFATENYKGVRLLRGYLYVPEVVTAVKRMAHEATFCLFAFLNFCRAGRHDVIVVFTPPFLLGGVGWFFAKLWRCPLVVNIQDVPLDAASSLGMVREGLFLRTLSAVERRLYRAADLVVTISDSMLRGVLRKGVDASRTALVPNWINVDRDGAPRSRGGFAARHARSSGRFLVAYAGNLGVKQGVDSLLHLAKRMEHNGEFHFFLIGDGADKPRLISLAEEMHLRNVTFLPLMDQESYKDMLADVDVVFIAQRSGAGDNFFPSKLLGIMAQGKPLLVSADPGSELARRVREWGCGVVAGFNETEDLREHLLQLHANRERLAALGANGKAAVRQFDRSLVLGDFTKAIWRLVDGRRNHHTPSRREGNETTA